jgi:predicted kinase
MLYIFGGLPGTGKSTLSLALAREIHGAYLRVDVVEQSLRAAGIWIDGPAGYMVCYDIAAQNLRAGIDVVADAVNPVRETRQAWRDVAIRTQAAFAEIEVICSDTHEHQQRIASRTTDIPGLALPSWSAVASRQYDPWDEDYIVVDTAHQTVAESLITLRTKLMPLINPAGSNGAPSL